MKTRTCMAAACTMFALSASIPSIASAQQSLTAQHRHCQREFERTSEALGDAFARRDLTRFMAGFADDAIQINSLGQVLNGKPAIEAFYRAVMASNYTFKRTLLAQTINQCSSAVVVDRIEFTIPSAGITLHAIDVANWARERGQWRLSADTTTPIANP
ncbi:YybH family protein [Pseudomonas sp. CGJS7]|uniref:YybH family protein n=1 Tax=Pseudomonas sp. CGJS7 TaxID=3109348 RepID=UPI003008377F